MSTASVLIAADDTDGAVPNTGPRYTLLLSTDPALIEAALRTSFEQPQSWRAVTAAALSG